MQELVVAIFGVQGAAMFFDEFYYHRRRGLPKWERIGHPLDTISVLTAFAFIFLNTPTLNNLYWFIGLALFSSLLVTKDEFVHKHYCSAGETWLHSLLFILHPIVFLAAGFIWYNIEITSPMWLALKIQFGLIISFLIYQITYWNFICKTKQI